MSANECGETLRTLDYPVAILESVLDEEVFSLDSIGEMVAEEGFEPPTKGL